METKKSLGYMAAMGYATIIGFSFIFVKGILNHADVIDVLMFRYLFAFLPLLALYPLKKKECDFSFQRIKVLLLIGITYPLCFFGAQTFALNISSSIEVSAVQATAPVFTLILAGLYLREKTNLLQKISVLLCVSGVLYIMIMKFIKNTAPDFRGIAITFIATLAFSAYTVLARKYKKDYSSYEILFVIFGEALAIMTAASVTKHIAQGSLSSIFNAFQSRSFIIGILYLSLLSTLASGYLINFALARIEASKMIVFNNLGTVIQIFAGVIILQETLFPSHIIGSILIILGILGVNLLGQVDDIKAYIPTAWAILSVLSFITGVFTFIMGTQNISTYYVGSQKMLEISPVSISMAELGNSYALTFYVMTLLFACLGLGFAGLYYLADKKLSRMIFLDKTRIFSLPGVEKE